MSVKIFSKSRSAFTLIEVLAVICITCILLGMGVGYSRKAQEIRTNQDIENFVGSIETMPSIAKSIGFLRYGAKQPTGSDTSTLEKCSISDGKEVFYWKVVKYGQETSGGAETVMREGKITPNGKSKLMLEYSPEFKSLVEVAENLKAGAAMFICRANKDNTRNSQTVLGAIIYNENGTPVYPGKIALSNYKNDKATTPIRRVEITITKNSGILRKM